MNQVPRDLLGRFATAALGFAQRSVLLVLGTAIFLAVLSLPGHEAAPDPAPLRDYGVVEEFGSLNVTMRAHPRAGVSSIILRDQAGREVLRTGYDHQTRTTFLIDQTGTVRTRYRSRADGRATVSLDGQEATTEIDFQRNGSRDPIVTRRDR